MMPDTRDDDMCAKYGHVVPGIANNIPSSERTDALDAAMFAILRISAALTSEGNKASPDAANFVLRVASIMNQLPRGIREHL